MSLVNNIKTDLAEHQTRQELLDCLYNEKQQIISAIEKFYSQRHSDSEGNALQALEEMISAFDRVIAAGHWEASAFLRNTLRPLKKMREEAWQLREQLLGNNQNTVIQRPQLAPGMVKVYIAIFQNKAHNAQDWEPQLRSLPQYILGRPIYRDEAAVIQSLRNKLVQTSDAYVCVGIPESAIQTHEFHPSQQDKQGNLLLQLMPGAVRSEYILEFVYQEKRYYFVDGKLIDQF